METDVLYTLDDYLALEAKAYAEAEDVKHEFDGSHVHAMAGASVEHVLTTGNIHTALNTRLAERRCRVMQSDLRVRLPSGRYTYPDVAALCAAPEVTEEKPPSLLNPELVVEVASSSTAERDRTWKLEGYLRIESLQEYWIVEVDAPRLQQYARAGEDWTVRVLHGLDAQIQSESLALDIPLREIYRLVFE